MCKRAVSLDPRFRSWGIWLCYEVSEILICLKDRLFLPFLEPLHVALSSRSGQWCSPAMSLNALTPSLRNTHTHHSTEAPEKGLRARWILGGFQSLLCPQGCLCPWAAPEQTQKGPRQKAGIPGMGLSAVEVWNCASSCKQRDISTFFLSPLRSYTQTELLFKKMLWMWVWGFFFFFVHPLSYVPSAIFCFLFLRNIKELSN